MDLILWRHAEAEEGGADLERQLTAKGRKQAERVAQWLLQRLSGKFSVISSPAARAQQTAEALQAANWPDHKGAVVLVGHQPDFGRAVAYLVSGQEAEWRIKKGGFWWVSNKNELIVRAVVSPDLL